MSLDPNRIERALDELAVVVGDSSYFVRHRARFESDATMLGAIHDQGPVLEVGAVPGHFSALLRLLDVPSIGVDVAPERMHALTARFDLDVRRCDIERERLPFDDSTLRYVVCNEVFEHLRVDPIFALAEVNRVLVPGGYLLLTTPNLYAVQQILRFFAGRGIGDPLAEFMKLRTLGHMGHVREYSHRDIRRFLAHAGFEIERTRFKHYYYGGGKRGLAKRIIFAIAPPPLRSFQVILARKKCDVPRIEPLDG